MNWTQTTAIFGGRFDPPHLGHREAVKGLFDVPRVKQVLVMPSAAPAYKIAHASAEDRLKMAQLNFQASSAFTLPSEVSVSPLEMTRAQKHPHLPTYAYDTIQELRSDHPDLSFVIGTDQLTQLSTWYRFLDLLTACHWIVLERLSEGSQIVQQTLTDWQASNLIRPLGPRTWKLRGSTNIMTLVPTQAPAISSTQIRETLAKKGTPPAQSLLPEVWAYLKQKKLYGISNSNE